MKLQIALAAMLAQAWAQSDPPPVLKIVQEAIKPGKSAAHEKIEGRYVRAFQGTGFPNYVTWEAMTGATQVWFVEGFANYAGIGAASKIANAEPLKTALDQLEAQDSELRTGERTVLARYQKNLGYVPEPLAIGKAHFVWTEVVRIQRGRTEDYAEMRRIQNSAFEKVGAKWTRIVYSLGSGAAATDYLVIWPMGSLGEMDDPPRWNSREVLGEAFERYRRLYADVIASSEEILFAVNPKMSNPPKSYIDADPNFWTPKPVVK